MNRADAGRRSAKGIHAKGGSPDGNVSKLKQKVEEADRSIKAAVAQEDAELKATVDEVRKNADQRAAELRAKSEEAADQAERHPSSVGSCEPARRP